MNLEDHQRVINNIMGVGVKTEMYHSATFPLKNDNVHVNVAPLREGKRMETRRSYAQGNAKRRLFMSYFSSESFFLLVCLTASVLLLPLILPPLPPPPFMLLLLPICILVLLVILAFSPSQSSGRNVSHSYL